MNDTGTGGRVEDGAWEKNVYAPGRQLNCYPFDFVVASVTRRFGGLARQERSGIKILEVGCGAGNNVWFLAREGYSVAGIDAAPTAVEFAHQHLRDDRLEADLGVGDFGSLPWTDGRFDAVLDRFSVTHNRRAHITETLAEIRRVLKPGGQLFSQLASTADTGRRFGEELGDGAIESFTAGLFLDLGVTFFASRDTLTSLLHGLFEIERLVHVRSEDLLSGETRAWFEVMCHA